jgi:monoamine oxidase
VLSCALGALASGAGLKVMKPWRKVHFVGTETSDVWKGYMEAAVRSSRRGTKEARPDC